MDKENSQSETGLHKNTAASLAALLGPTIVAPFVLLILEKDSYVRFYAMQSILVFVGLWALSLVLKVTIVLIPLVPVVWIAMFSSWLLMVYKASQGETWEVPLFGRYARHLLVDKRR